MEKIINTSFTVEFCGNIIKDIELLKNKYSINENILDVNYVRHNLNIHEITNNIINILSENTINKTENLDIKNMLFIKLDYKNSVNIKNNIEKITNYSHIAILQLNHNIYSDGGDVYIDSNKQNIDITQLMFIPKTDFFSYLNISQIISGERYFFLFIINNNLFNNMLSINKINYSSMTLDNHVYVNNIIMNNNVEYISTFYNSLKRIERFENKCINDILNDDELLEENKTHENIENISILFNSNLIDNVNLNSYDYDKVLNIHSINDFNHMCEAIRALIEYKFNYIEDFTTLKITKITDNIPLSFKSPILKLNSKFYDSAQYGKLTLVINVGENIIKYFFPDINVEFTLNQCDALIIPNCFIFNFIINVEKNKNCFIIETILY